MIEWIVADRYHRHRRFLLLELRQRWLTRELTALRAAYLAERPVLDGSEPSAASAE